MGHKRKSKTDANQRLDFASFMLGFVAPLPFHPAPLSSSKPKQLG
jgi:hypothetical protein